MSYVGLFAVLLILSALSACALALYALTRRDIPSAPAFILLLAGEFIWATGYLRELGADGLTAKLFWDNLQFIGMQLCGVGALVFALVYSRNERVARRIRPLLWVEPSLTTLVVWTSARHGWLRSAPAIDTSTGYPQLVYEYGPWFWVSATSNLSLVVLALGVLGVFASSVRGRYRSSALIVIAGLSAPVGGGLLTISGLLSIDGLRRMDLSPLTFSIATTIIAWGLFRTRLLETVPIAREQLLEQLDEAVIVVDSQGLLADCNAQGRDLLTAQGRPLTGLPIAQLCPVLSAQIPSGGGPGRRLALADRPDLRAFEGTLSPLHTRQRRFAGWLIVLRDVTEQRQAAEALLRAKEVAEAADRAKSAFLATMSHEIRTPLNAVIGMADLLLAAELPDELREYAATITMSGQTLLAIINNVLDLSKIGAGRVELELRPFDLPTSLEEVAGMVSHSAAAKGLGLRCLLDPSLPPRVVGDVTRLRQVVVNLLSNALKFTDAGEVTLRASAAPAAAGEFAVTIVVQDTGIGIAPEQQEQIFQPFAQADSSMTRRYGGSGLGLAISKQLIELMGGTISVVSSLGAGATFTVLLPLRTAEASADVAVQPPLGGRRVLVVEGKQDLRAHVVKLLERLGAEVYAVATGGEALGWAAGGASYDLGLIGEQLAGLDSPTIARALARLPHVQRSPLFLLGADEPRPALAVQGPFAGSLTPRTLPAALGAAVTGQPAAQAHGRPTRARAALRVLVVEDNPINQEVTEHMLTHLGHSVAVVSDGLAALEAIGRSHFDVVLMDIQMPDIDGATATRRIRGLGAAIAQPWIIALTASALAGDRERYLAAGMDDYLGKPVRLESLAAALGRSLSPQRR